MLLRRLGVKPEQINELVEIYHAVEHLGKIAALQGRWTASERQAWIGRQRRRLLKGGVDSEAPLSGKNRDARHAAALDRRETHKRRATRGLALRLPLSIRPTACLVCHIPVRRSHDCREIAKWPRQCPPEHSHGSHDH